MPVPVREGGKLHVLAVHSSRRAGRRDLVIRSGRIRRWSPGKIDGRRGNASVVRGAHFRVVQRGANPSHDFALNRHTAGVCCKLGHRSCCNECHSERYRSNQYIFSPSERHAVLHGRCVGVWAVESDKHSDQLPTTHAQVRRGVLHSPRQTLRAPYALATIVMRQLMRLFLLWKCGLRRRSPTRAPRSRASRALGSSSCAVASLRAFGGVGGEHDTIEAVNIPMAAAHLVRSHFNYDSRVDQGTAASGLRVPRSATGLYDRRADGTPINVSSHFATLFQATADSTRRSSAPKIDG